MQCMVPANVAAAAIFSQFTPLCTAVCRALRLTWSQCQSGILFVFPGMPTGQGPVWFLYHTYHTCLMTVTNRLLATVMQGQRPH